MRSFPSDKRPGLLQLLTGILAGCLLSCASTQRSIPTAPLPTLAEQTQKYNLQLDFLKHHFSGLLVARRLPDNEIRILASTYFGLSLFDFSLREDTFRVNHCVEPMRKEKILRLLESDLKSLFLGNPAARVRKREGMPERRTSGRGFGRTVMTLGGDTGEEAGAIRIRHPWIRLTLQVNPLTEETTP